MKKQQVLSQFNENTLVKGVGQCQKQFHFRYNSLYSLTFQELDLLEEDAQVFKLVGPVLLSVELEDSKQNVGKRLEFIETELKKIDSNIASKQQEMNELGDQIAEAQQKLQSEAAVAAKQAAGLV